MKDKTMEDTCSEFMEEYRGIRVFKFTTSWGKCLPIITTIDGHRVFTPYKLDKPRVQYGNFDFTYRPLTIEQFKEELDYLAKVGKLKVPH